MPDPNTSYTPFAYSREISPHGQLPLQAEAFEICQRLLRMDGKYVSVPLTMLPYCGGFAAYGRTMKPAKIKRQRGAARQCHHNTIGVYQGGKIKGRIATGFAMHGGQWVNHTWMILPDQTIVETTGPFERYFGVILSDEGATQFCEKYLSENWDREESWIRNQTVVQAA